MTQEDVSAASGIHVTEVSRIERAVRNPSMSTMFRLADALGVPPADLVAEP
jgi:transcriptional regulator with XRE-family HTH domain